MIQRQPTGRKRAWLDRVSPYRISYFASSLITPSMPLTASANRS